MGSRFDMAFEPVEGNVAQGDEAFLPKKGRSYLAEWFNKFVNENAR